VRGNLSVLHLIIGHCQGVLVHVAHLALCLSLAVTPSLSAAQAQRPDTVVIRPRAGGVWRTPRTATELLVVEGTGEGQEFGDLMDVLALSDGRVVVFDGRGVSGPELLLLDSSGSRLRQLGRSGAGPGEYGGSINLGALAEGPGGEIWLFDRSSQRILRWGRDGSVLSAVVPTVSIGPILNSPLFAGPTETLFVPAQVRDDPSNPNGAHVYGYLRLGLSGQVLDSLTVPKVAGNPEMPSPFWPQ